MAMTKHEYLKLVNSLTDIQPYINCIDEQLRNRALSGFEKNITVIIDGNLSQEIIDSISKTYYDWQVLFCYAKGKTIFTFNL